MPDIKKLPIGFQRHPFRFFAECFAVYSVLWTVFNSLSKYLTSFHPNGTASLSVFVVVSAGVGVLRALPKSDVRFRFGSTHTYLRVRFGDLFAANGLRAIPVNEFFDSQLGDQVSERSVHGQLIKTVFGGSALAFDAVIDPKLDHIRRRGSLVGKANSVVIQSEPPWSCQQTMTGISSSRQRTQIRRLSSRMRRLKICGER